MDVPTNGIAPFDPHARPAPAGLPPPLDPALARMRTLGSAATVLAILDLCSGGLALLSGLVVSPLMGVEKRILATLPGQAAQAQLLEASRQWMNRVALWNGLRLLPFAVASVLLLRIAPGLRRGARESLDQARIWSLGALGVVAFSLLLQLAVLLPMSVEYQHSIVELQRAAVPPGMAGVQEVAQSASNVVARVMPILGALVMAIWPITLRTVAGRLQRTVW